MSLSVSGSKYKGLRKVATNAFEGFFVFARITSTLFDRTAFTPVLARKIATDFRQPIAPGNELEWSEWYVVVGKTVYKLLVGTKANAGNIHFAGAFRSGR